MKFQRKPFPVDAVQWHPGADIPGLIEAKPVIQWSRDRSSYYIQFGDLTKLRPTRWLESAKTPGRPTDEQIAACGMFTPYFSAYKHPVDDPLGGPYYRRVWDFVCFDVKGGPEEETTTESELFVDYWLAEKWDEEVVKAGFRYLPIPGKSPASHGTMACKHYVYDNDWIITNPDGTRRVITDESFQADYEPIP